MEHRRSFLGTLIAIAWSFIGLRRKKDFEVDNEQGLNPIFVVIAALVGVLAFISTLLFFVRMAVS